MVLKSPLVPYIGNNKVVPVDPKTFAMQDDKARGIRRSARPKAPPNARRRGRVVTCIGFRRGINVTSQRMRSLCIVWGPKPSPAQKNAQSHDGMCTSWCADEKLPVLIYKEGEPLRELSRFLSEGEGQLVEVRIPAESMSNANRQVRRLSLLAADVLPYIRIDSPRFGTHALHFESGGPQQGRNHGAWW